MIQEDFGGRLPGCQFIPIELDSGDYFSGSPPLEAIKGGKRKYAEKTFHVMKVGYHINWSQVYFLSIHPFHQVLSRQLNIPVKC